MVVGAANHVAVLRDVGTGRTLHEWRVGSRVTSVAYSHDGAWVLTADEGYEVELHDARTGKTVRKWRYEASAEAVAITPNGRWALMGFADGYRHPLRRPAAGTTARARADLPDAGERLLVTGDAGPTARVRKQKAARRERPSLHAPAGATGRAAASPCHVLAPRWACAGEPGGTVTCIRTRTHSQRFT